MTTFSSQSQLVTLSRLDRLLWDAPSPVALLMESARSERFLEGMMVSHLRGHEIRNQGIVFTPAGEKGIIHSLAEAVAALYEDIDPAELAAMPPSQWPGIWQGKRGKFLHRLLIIERFEQILEESFEERWKFCCLLHHFSTAENHSVLVFTEPDFAERFGDLPGFEDFERGGYSIQITPVQSPLPALDRFPVSRKGISHRAKVLTTFGTIGVIIAFLTIGFRFPGAGNANELAMASSAPLQALQETGIRPFPEPLGIEVAVNFGLSGYSERYVRDPDSSMQRFMEREVSLGGTEYHEIAAGMVVQSVPSPVSYRFPTNGYAAVSAKKRYDRLDVKTTLAPDDPPAIPTPELTPLPLTVEELLGKFKLMNRKSLAELDETLQVLKMEFPKRNSEQVSDWVSRIGTGRQDFDLVLAEAYAEQKDTEATFAWYQDYANRISSPDALFLVGAAQFFGRGTAVDYPSATETLFRAWQAGNADAAYLYSIAQMLGLGVNKSETKAYHTLNRAMEMGSQLACRDAARIQELGIGVSQNLYWACHLYEEGAKSGDPYCMQRLAEIFGTGENRLYPIDQVKADRWINAIEQAQADPIHRYVERIMPVNFYTRKVVKY